MGPAQIAAARPPIKPRDMVIGIAEVSTRDHRAGFTTGVGKSGGEGDRRREREREVVETDGLFADPICFSERK